ncbi:PEP-CTERM sorting domain-containing protein [Rosistilla oblonga]|uniref:PEP-CTERM sorting domain-containing protein n=1 Tax=Rosistilla oblonga TaxID=2527990 RepID=UPI003A96E801
MKKIFLLAVLLSVPAAPVSSFAGTITVLGNATVRLDESTASFNIDETGTLSAEPYTFLRNPELVTNSGHVYGESFLGIGLETSYVKNKVAYNLSLNHDAETSTSYASFDVKFRFDEDWKLAARLPTAVLPEMDLLGKYSFSARSEYFGGGATGDAYDVSVFTGIDFDRASFGETVFSDGFSKSINTRLGVRYGVAGQSQGRTTIEVLSILKIPGDSIFRVFSGNSLDLVRVEFEDGTTPEDHGFDFVRSSGRVSPNLTAVPEPSSLSMFAVIGTTVLLRRRYRSKQ